MMNNFHTELATGRRRKSLTTNKSENQFKLRQVFVMLRRLEKTEIIKYDSFDLPELPVAYETKYEECISSTDSEEEVIAKHFCETGELINNKDPRFSFMKSNMPPKIRKIYPKIPSDWSPEKKFKFKKKIRMKKIKERNWKTLPFKELFKIEKKHKDSDLNEYKRVMDLVTSNISTNFQKFKSQQEHIKTSIETSKNISSKTSLHQLKDLKIKKITVKKVSLENIINGMKKSEVTHTKSTSQYQLQELVKIPKIQRIEEDSELRKAENFVFEQNFKDYCLNFHKFKTCRDRNCMKKHDSFIKESNLSIKLDDYNNIDGIFELITTFHSSIQHNYFKEFIEDIFLKTSGNKHLYELERLSRKFPASKSLNDAIKMMNDTLSFLN